MRRPLYLHGTLRDFGGPYYFDVSSPAEMVAGLASQYDAFRHQLLKGRYHLIAGPLRRARPLGGRAVFEPCYAPNYHLYPVLSGAARQRGKMVLGLTLLGLSFAPGVSAGMSSLGTMATGSASFGQGLASLGTQLMARTGQFMMSQGAMQSISPPQYQPTDEIRSSRIGARATATEGHVIPLIYGQVRVHQPLYIETGLQIETTSHL